MTNYLKLLGEEEGNDGCEAGEEGCEEDTNIPHVNSDVKGVEDTVY